MILDYATRERLSAVIDFPEDGGRPPQTDWYVALELSHDLQVDIFRLEGIPMEEPYISIVKQWAFIRRSAQVMASDIQADRQRIDAELAKGHGSLN